MSAPDGRPQGAAGFENHSEYEPFVRNVFRSRGVDVTVSTAPPLVRGTYTEPGMTCPHGTTFWFEPTGDQIAAWARDGVR